MSFSTNSSMSKKRGVEVANLSSHDEESKQHKLSTHDTSVKISGSKFKEDISSLTQKLGEVYVAQVETADTVQFHTGFIETVSSRLLTLEQKERERERKYLELETELITTKEELNKVRTDVKDIGKDVRSCNMIINGLKEKANENCKNAALDFLRKLIPDIKSDCITNAYRVGKSAGDGEVNRALFVKFKDGETKGAIMKKKGAMFKDKSLGLKHVYCNDDLTEESRQLRQEIREIARYAKDIGYMDAKVTGDKLYVQGKFYAEDELHLLPENLLMSNVRTRKIGGGVGFYSKHSYLSNFFPAPLTINGLNFCCSEQAYQYSKTVVCNKEEAGKEIRKIRNPKKIKRFGDKIDTCEEWEKNKDDVMRCILMAKFAQNRDLKIKLKETGEAPLFECTSNSYWGTGWKLDAPQWRASSQFPGRNTLGKLLVEVRSALCIKKAASRLYGDFTVTRKANTTLRDIQEGDVDSHDNTGVDVKATSKDEEHSPALSAAAVKECKASEQKITASESEPGTTVGSSKLTETASVIVAKAIKCDEGAESVSDGTSAPESGTESMEMDEDGSSLSLDSDVFGTSFNARSIMTEEGHIDHSKMMGWALPTMDLSRLRDIAATSFPEIPNKTTRSSHRGRAVSLTHSTPVTQVVNRKTRRAKKSTSDTPPIEEQWDLVHLLAKIRKK